MQRVLVVDDEPAVRRFVKGCLAMAGYEVLEAATGTEAVEAVRNHKPQGVILDLGLPDLEGIDVTRVIRGWSSVPIVIVSVRDSEEEIADTLDAGADDYLVKPFGVKELLARLRAALRRADNSPTEAIFRSGELKVDLENRDVEVQGQPVLLTPTEFDLLKVLIRYASRVLTHGQILQMVWGEQYVQDLQLLRVNISNLRRKIEPEPRRPIHVLTELGVGYRLQLLEPELPA